jgi:CO dehydrogenase/acetyl-CoA synthase epsilon subunit
MIKRAARPILVVGSNATERWMEGKQLIDYLIDFAKASKVPIVATAHMVGEFLKRGYEPAGFMNAMDIGNRLVDPTWQGLDGKGHPDLAMCRSSSNKESKPNNKTRSSRGHDKKSCPPTSRGR